MKFQIGDRAKVCYNAGVRYDFLYHYFEMGKEVEIVGLFTGWKGYEAYNIRINGRRSSEILLAEELEPLTIKT